MNNEAFVRYLNSDDVHDGKIRQIVEEADRVRIFVDTVDGRLIVFDFGGVREVRRNGAEGMLLYCLSELREAAPFRKYSFGNWDEEDDAYLEVIARDVSCHEISEGSDGSS